MITNGCTYCEASGWLCDECDVERPIADIMVEACYNAATSIQHLNEAFAKLRVNSEQINIELAKKAKQSYSAGTALSGIMHGKNGQTVIITPSSRARRLIRKLQKRKQ